MQVTCSCGKALNVPDSQAGKNARCPACQKVFKVPAGPAPHAAPPTKIPFQCSCGKRLSAPLSAGGKKVLCPACNKELVVPAAPKPAAAQGTPAPAPAPAKPAPAAVPGKPAPAAPVIVPAPSKGSVVAPQRKKGLGTAPAPAPKVSPAAPPPVPDGDEFGLALEDPVAPPPPPPPAAKAAPKKEPEPEPEKAEYVIGGMKCPHCKAELDAAAQFCVSCGTSLATGSKVEGAKVVPPKKGLQKLDLKNIDPETKKKIITAAVAILAIIGIAIYLYFTMFRKR